MKIKYEVSPAPTGRYRSFERRAWPTGSINERPAIRFECDDPYVPSKVKAGNHKELTVLIADWTPRRKNPEGPAFVWRKAKEKAATLKEAKDLAKEIIDKNAKDLGYQE